MGEENDIFWSEITSEFGRAGATTHQIFQEYPPSRVFAIRKHGPGVIQ